GRMFKPALYLLFYVCTVCYAASGFDKEINGLLFQKQQGPVEVHWYNTYDSLFELRSAAQLKGFAELVSSGIDFHQQEVRLVNDIFLNDTTGWRDWEHDAQGYLEQWIPI